MAKFEMRTPPGTGADGKPRQPEEYIEIGGLNTGKDSVSRRATDEDRQRYSSEYAEFKKSQEEQAQSADASADAQPMDESDAGDDALADEAVDTDAMGESAALGGNEATDGTRRTAKRGARDASKKDNR